MLRNAFEPWHLVVLIVVIAIVFGWKKLPDAARSLGRSARIFKSEIEEMKHDGTPNRSAAARDTVDGEKVTRTETTVSEDTPSGERVTQERVEETREGTSTGSTRAPGA